MTLETLAKDISKSAKAEADAMIAEAQKEAEAIIAEATERLQPSVRKRPAAPSVKQNRLPARLLRALAKPTKKKF